MTYNFNWVREGQYLDTYYKMERKQISLLKFVEIIDGYDSVPLHIKEFWKNYAGVESK